LDRDGREGGINFRKWSISNGWNIPFERDYIANLSESVNLTSKTIEADVVSWDEVAEKFEF